ncbi:hypothetical protein CAE01nite_06840 [Cellulomonas aerilata]|uniref:Uncharacterized protein n=1 Tax=Cellulomonas aerilata TaxID=515326 RepID=A0A512D913_9CELL|nr:hypothetical protein CAE01nite_06840 [Cellulomonas aerilata]
MVETSGARPGPGPGAAATEALPTGAPTRPVPTTGPRTQALPTGGPATTALPTGSAAPVAAGGAGEARATDPAGGVARDAEAAGGPTAGATTATTATPTTPTTAADRPVDRSLRVGTVVWGLIIAIIGVGFIAVAAGARFDVELVLIGLLALAGVALVAGSMAVSLRRRH